MGALRDEDWFDPAWLEEVPPPEGTDPIPVSACAPSGWLALELDHATADPAVLSDATLIDMSVGFDRVTSWASARQAGLLAEFARRRPSDNPPPTDLLTDLLTGRRCAAATTPLDHDACAHPEGCECTPHRAHPHHLR